MESIGRNGAPTSKTENRLMVDRRSFCFSVGGLLLLSRGAFPAQTNDFQAKTYRNSKDETLPYRLFVPQPYEKKKRYPLMLWLHGGAGRGIDNVKQISGGNTLGSHVWTTAEQQTDHPCFVLAPQCPEDSQWATEDKVIPTRPLELVLELLKELHQTFSVDQQRLYVSGQSMGGFGTWSLIAQNPRMFAAAIPICGGGDESAAVRLKAMSIWAFHGAQDEAVSVTRSRTMIAAIKRAGGTPRYTEICRRRPCNLGACVRRTRPDTLGLGTEENVMKAVRNQRRS
jgi:predicted peptidase